MKCLNPGNEKVLFRNPYLDLTKLKPGETCINNHNRAFPKMAGGPGTEERHLRYSRAVPSPESAPGLLGPRAIRPTGSMWDLEPN